MLFLYFLERRIIPDLYIKMMHATIFIKLFNKVLQNKYKDKPKATFEVKEVAAPRGVAMPRATRAVASGVWCVFFVNFSYSHIL